MPIKTAEELAQRIRKRIEDGELKPGDRLEPIRKVAGEVGLNRNTVAAAYKKLQQNGLVEPSGRNMRVSLRPVVVDEEYSRKTYPDVKDLSFNNPDPSLLPDWNVVLANFRVDTPVLYGDSADNDNLCDLFSDLHTRLGYPVGEVTIGAGNTEAMARLLGLYTSFGDKVAVEDPCYMKLLHLVRAQGLTPVPLSLDEEGIQPQSLQAALESGVKAVFVTPRAQNPTGVSIAKKRAGILREVLKKHPQVLLVEDEHLGPLVEHKANSLVTATREHWAVLHSPAKYLGPDLRTGAIVGSPRLMARLRTQRALGGYAVSHMLQTLTHRLFEHSEKIGTITHASKIYKERREYFERQLEKLGISHFSGTGLNVWIPMQNAEWVAARLFREGWDVQTGSDFCIVGGNGLRVTISTLQKSDAQGLAEAIVAHNKPK